MSSLHTTASSARSIGLRGPVFRGVVERVKIVEYAQALRLRNPIHFDRDAAVAAGWRDLVAPPGFMNPFTLQPRSAKFETFAIDERQALAGQWEWEHHGVVCAGDELQGHSELVDVQRKVGKRPMQVLVIETRFCDLEGRLRVVVRDTTMEFEKVAG